MLANAVGNKNVLLVLKKKCSCASTAEGTAPSMRTSGVLPLAASTTSGLW
jgi:hypothetical protein